MEKNPNLNLDSLGFDIICKEMIVGMSIGLVPTGNPIPRFVGPGSGNFFGESGPGPEKNSPSGSGPG